MRLFPTNRSACARFASGCVVVAALALVGEGTALAACTPPEYRMVQSFIAGSDAPPIVQGTGSARVVVARAQYTVARLVCLVETLRAAHPEWKRVTLEFFTSERAAASFSPGGSVADNPPFDPTGSTSFATELRATYTLDTSRGESQLAILPLGLLSASALSTIINLPTPWSATCELAVGRRCVLALAPIPQAGEIWRRGIVGFVTLSAIVQPSGAVAGVEVMVAGAGSGEEGRLVAASVANLMTWWIEPADVAERVTVTYDYEFVGPAPTDALSLTGAMPRIRVSAERPK